MPSMRDIRKAARSSRPWSERVSVGIARIGQAIGLPMKARNERSNRARAGSMRSSTPGGGARSASCRASSAASAAGPARFSPSALRHSPRSSAALARTSSACIGRSSRVSDAAAPSVRGGSDTSWLPGDEAIASMPSLSLGVDRSSMVLATRAPVSTGTVTLSDLRSVSAARNCGIGDSMVSRREGGVCWPASISAARPRANSARRRACGLRLSSLSAVSQSDRASWARPCSWWSKPRWTSCLISSDESFATTTSNR